MKIKDDLDKKQDLNVKKYDDLAESFRNFPHLIMLTLWFCMVPMVLIIVAWIWGFWEAIIASLIILIVMIGICQAFCLKGKMKR